MEEHGKKEKQQQQQQQQQQINRKTWRPTRTHTPKSGYLVSNLKARTHWPLCIKNMRQS